MIENLKTLSDAIFVCLDSKLWFDDEKREDLSKRLKPVVDGLEFFGVEMDKMINFNLINLSELRQAAIGLHDALSQNRSSEIQQARRGQFSRQLAVFDQGGEGDAKSVVEPALLSESVKRMYEAEGTTYWVLRGCASHAGLDYDNVPVKEPFMVYDGMVYHCNRVTLEREEEYLVAPDDWADDAIVEGPLNVEEWKAIMQPAS